MKTGAFKISLLAFAGFFLAGIFLMGYLQNALRGTTMTLGVDLYPRWVGAQSVLDGESPYSFETRQKIWQAVYGKPDVPSGNPFGFYYPPAVVTLLFPFILAGLSLETAAVLWCAFLWALWSALLLGWVTSIPIPPKARLVLLPLLLLSGIAFRPAYSNYLLGQYSLFSIGMLALAWFALKHQRHVAAGVFGALCLIKFSLTLLPLAILFFAYRANSKTLLSFGIASLILYLPPTLMLGWWIPDFLRDISGYASENAVAWDWTRAASLSGLGWLALSLLLLLRSLRRRDADLAVAASLALNAVFVPHTADYDLVAFVPLLALLGKDIIADRRIPPFLSWTLFGLLIWFPWISLLYYIRQPLQDAVEAWYIFIWLAYPLMILTPVFLYEEFKARMSIREFSGR
ncbi:MAG: glycosyltransferase family 87 protein [Chloroflexota bacterium]